VKLKLPRYSFGEKQNLLSLQSLKHQIANGFCCVKAGVGNPRAKCGLTEHLNWPASEFSLPNLERKISSKRSSMISRHFETMSREASIPHSKIELEFLDKINCFLRPDSENPPVSRPVIVNRFPTPVSKAGRSAAQPVLTRPLQ